MSVPGAFEGLEQVESEAYGTGWLAEANEHQPRDLILFDKKKPPRDEGGRPVFAVIFGSDEPVCGSKKRGKAAYCCQSARYESGRCEDHGGKSLKGMASPQWKHGERSRFAPRVAGHLQERFDLLMADDKLHHHRKSIAALDAMIDELWETYQVGWDPQIAMKVHTTYRAMRAAEKANNRLRALELLEALGQQIEDLVAVTQTPEKIVRFMEHRRRHADSEARRMISERLVFTLEEAQHFYTALGAAVNRHVTDEKERRAILDEIAAVVGARGPTDRNGPTSPPGG